MKKIIIANWKMNPTNAKEAKRLFESVRRVARKAKKVELMVAAPFVFLPVLKSGVVKLAAQDVFLKDTGPWTGEISASMLKALKISHVIVGHSERRELGDSDELINKKIKSALSKGLKVVLCVGEKVREPEAVPEMVRREIKEGLKGITKKFSSRVLIAYEPVWAISTTKGARPDNPQNLFEMGIFIKRVLLDIWGRNAAMRMPILYGGSVNSKNAESFLKVECISGALVGGASLKPDEFWKIIEIAKRI
ncbi:triose-phosphate isomerase [Candidatus Giovannonibacteria bacterium]|nr:triose-phosphate isomerase [Candidatus Giovannonibacteria bacterium]